MEDLCSGKHMCISGTGSGKTAMMFSWLKSTGKKHILIITQASKRDSGDFEEDAVKFAGEEWKKSLSSFTVLSWEGLAKWWDNFRLNHASTKIKEYAIAYDEIQRAKAGISSKMGKSFLQIASLTDCWTGYTATPGDQWIDFYPYLVATKKVRNKTEFRNKYCLEQRYPFPKILKYLHQDKLVEFWRDISHTADTSEVMEQLPPQVNQTAKFKAPTAYKTILKTRKTEDGEFLDSIMALCHHLRQVCNTGAKQKWLAEWLNGLDGGAVIFYNYNEEGDKIEEIVKKSGRKVWRIDGRHHKIPTEETYGKGDIVVAHYQSGSASLNLQFLNHAVFYSPCYSYTTFTQAQGRIKRIGQQKTQFFYYLKTEKTIEEDVYKCLGTKKLFSEKVWALENNLTEEEHED